MNPIPLALYVHIPWCVRKCPYCDFNSHTSTSIPESDYLNALLEDLQQDLALAQGRSVGSIFFGGGTPSLLSAGFYQRLLAEIGALLSIKDQAEITLEANPGTLDFERFAGFQAAGINRLSIGVQSFNPTHLHHLGRIHSDQEAIQAIQLAQQLGFGKLNLDLMHGLPQQTAAESLADIQQALELGVSHLSWYQLTIEPNTAFYSTPPTLPVETELEQIESQGLQRLLDADFEHYETSAYAKTGHQCQHNLNYWEFGDYLAIGAGAHGKITNPEQNLIQRYQKTRLPQDYLNPDKSYTAKTETLAGQQRALEFFMNSFRLQRPIAKSLFTERTMLPLAATEQAIAQAQAQGLLLDQQNHWETTVLGRRYLNSLLQYFMP